MTIIKCKTEAVSFIQKKKEKKKTNTFHINNIVLNKRKLTSTADDSFRQGNARVKYI